MVQNVWVKPVILEFHKVATSLLVPPSLAKYATKLHKYTNLTPSAFRSLLQGLVNTITLDRELLLSHAKVEA